MRKERLVVGCFERLNASDALLSSLMPTTAADLIRRLLDAGAPAAVCDANGLTPLHHAVPADANSPISSGEVLRALVMAGADVNARDDRGWAPLHHAAHSLRVSEAQELLRLGADPRLLDLEGEAPLDVVPKVFQLHAKPTAQARYRATANDEVRVVLASALLDWTLPVSATSAGVLRSRL